MTAKNIVLTYRNFTLFILIFLIGFFCSPIASAKTSVLEQPLQLLTKKSYKDKMLAIEQITNSKSLQTEKLLTALLKGEVYYRRSDKNIFYFTKQENDYLIEDILTGEKSIIPKKRGMKKVTINNKLRGVLRQSIASLQLAHEDPEIRKSAVTEMLKKIDDDTLELLSIHVKQEADEDVKELMLTALAIGDLSSEDENAVLAAIKTLNGNLEPVVRNRLTELAENSESDLIKANAEKALKSIRAEIDLYGKLETLYFGLSFGSVLVLAGIGLAITFGVMGVINMAHGELIMIGAYTTYVVQQLMPNFIGASILVAIPAAFLVAGLVGILMERTVIRHLYGRPLETLLATFGISLILQQAVRSIFSPLNRTVVTPEWMSGTLDINSIFSLTWNRLYIIVFCLMVFFALMAVMKKTSLGLQVRAVSQNRAMARAMGVRSDWVDALTFGLGAGIAGVAGVALSLLTNVGPNLGQAYIIDSFMVVVFGGVGNLWGTLVAGMSLGVVNKLMEPWAGAVLAKILVLVFIILFIQKRPRGLFPQRGRAAEN